MWPTTAVCSLWMTLHKSTGSEVFKRSSVAIDVFEELRRCSDFMNWTADTDCRKLAALL
jgi:hypothetical protein